LSLTAAFVPRLRFFLLPCYFEIHVEIHKVIPTPDDSCNEYSAHEVIEAQKVDEDIHEHRNKHETRTDDTKKHHVAREQAALCIFKGEFPREDVINGDRNKESEACGNHMVNMEHRRHHVEKAQIEQERSNSDGSVFCKTNYRFFSEH
jgi:hypothetical protein